MTTTLGTEPIIVTEPGVYQLTHEQYLADPVPGGSLSASGAKKLLKPSCPAIYKWERDNPTPSSDSQEFGSAVHAIALGDYGREVRVIDADSWRTKDAREMRQLARFEGAIPMLPKDFETAHAMAAALADHALAMNLFTRGCPEQSLFWIDERTRVWRRARLDWLPDSDGRPVMYVPDYKTAKSSNPDAFARACVDYGYHLQAPFYLDGVRALGLADEVRFLFVVQEKTAPYLVTVCQLTARDMRLGRRLVDEALDIYADCQQSGVWPGYADTEVKSIDLPGWYTRQFEDEI